MINIIEVFVAFNTRSKYALLKSPDWSNLCETNTELDILCQNYVEILQIILSFMNKYIDQADQGYVINIEEKDSGHTKIDMVKGEDLHLRWNLYQSLPKFKKISIRDSLFDVIIERAVICKINRSGNESVEVYVPEFFDDLLLKYIEYQEFYFVQDDRVKNAEYIQALLTTEAMKNTFFDRISYYTKFSRIEE